MKTESINNLIWYQKADPGSPETIHQVLVYGSFEQLKGLESSIGLDKIKRVFTARPKKFYTKPEFNFIKNYILKIKEPLDESKYLKDTPRNIG